MPLQHVVKRGDSLWGLSGRHLGNFERWPELMKYHNAEARKSGGNRSRVFPIKDPNVIFVGQILYLPIRDKHMMRTVSATGKKSQAGNRAVPIDLRVKYTIGQSGKPIVYSQQVNNQTITIEMRGTITIKIVSPDRFKHNLELLMSENETRCRKKLKEIYNPAVVELTNNLEVEFQNGNPAQSSNGGIITIALPILSNAGINKRKIRLVLDTREKLKGKETLPNVCGYVSVDGRKISYEADVELSAEVNRNPINLPDSSEYKKNESIIRNSPQRGFFSKISEDLDAGIESVIDTFTNKSFQKEIKHAATQAGKTAVLAHTYTAAKAYALFDIAAAGPVTTTVLVAAGTPQGQYCLEGVVDSLSPMMPTTLMGAGFRIIQELYPRLTKK